MRDKYRGDYRLLETFTEDGKVHTDYEYIGKAYRYADGAGAAYKGRKKALTLVMAAAASWVAALIPFSHAMRTLWIALPFAFLILPLFLAAELLLTADVKTPFLERRHADRMNNRYPAVSVFICFFSAVVLIGCGLRMLAGGAAVSGDAVFFICDLLILACGISLMRKRRAFAVEEAAKQTGKAADA